MAISQTRANVTAELPKLKILLIGPGNSVPGGTAISFDHLLDALKAVSGVNIKVITSFGIRGSGILAPLHLLRLMGNIVWAVRRCDVLSFHAMPTALPYIGWFLPLVAMFYGKPLIFRSFGGMYYDELSWAGRSIAYFFMHRANVILLQTQELMRKAERDHLPWVEWFPTARPMPTETPSHRGICRRFVFIGHLKTAKGLQYLVKAAEKLPDDASVDIYGPWYDLPRGTFDNCKKIRYVRALLANEVVSTLQQYDALVFPTFMAEEGHSGIILESYAAGIPVIATRWKALPEIVEDGVTGLLIEPQNDAAILQAMMRLYRDSGLYHNLSDGVRLYRGKFSQKKQTDHFLNICRKLVHNKN